ncbi:hypothetical protein [Microlunatus sp. Y2014]|uniref:hypothetical protein n=1 Tax=Microlunatus sp. Y2014 TaxID=3418488 RepID=UPI003DA72246
MSRAEAEWTYLQRNIYAHQLDDRPAITDALQHAAGIEEGHEQLLLTQRAHQAVGMNPAQLASFARQLRLDAEADALPDKVRILRDSVGQALGHADGAAMATSPDYDPAPSRTRGWLTWGRIGTNADTLADTFKGKAIVHTVTAGNLAAVVASGVLASNERRKLMGITQSVGMSESSDQKTGGARGVFTRLASTKGIRGGGSQRIVWDDPGRLLHRTDWYGYNGDHFGAVVNGAGHSTHGQTRSPDAAAKFSAHNNEIIIAHGLDLFGADAPSRIMCGTAAARDEMITNLQAAGITEIGGRPLSKVVRA